MGDSRISPHGPMPQAEAQQLEPRTLDIAAISSTTGRVPLPRSIDGIHLSGEHVSQLFSEYASLEYWNKQGMH